MALYKGLEKPVFVRVAEHDGRIYIDLCNEKWQVVEVDAAGWRVIDHSPVMFRRAKAMLELPTPVAGGSIELLRAFIPIEDRDFVLVVAWLVASLSPWGPYALLQLDGEQGSGKSTRARMLRSLVDPNSADLRCEPRNTQDLMLAANNAHVLAYDNLSYMPDWLSDGLCRLASGGSFSTRALYTNEDETILTAQRPVILTGIEQLASRGDLIERALLVTLPAIPPDERRTEKEIWDEFRRDQPLILGALLTAVSVALKQLPNTRLRELPRMADFATWVTAAEEGFGWAPGAFMAAYGQNRESADSLAIESLPIGPPLLLLVAQLREGETVCYTATELLAVLERNAGLEDSSRKPKGWPGSPKALSEKLKRIGPHLRNLGLKIEHGRESTRDRTRRIDLTKVSTATLDVQGQDLDCGAPDAGWAQPDAMRTHGDPEENADWTHADAVDAVSANSATGVPDLPPTEEELGEWVAMLRKDGIRFWLAEGRAERTWPPEMDTPRRRQEWETLEPRVRQHLAREESSGKSVEPRS